MVLVGDISKFFDNLDHKILKENLKKVLKTDELDENIYKMLKSLTKSTYIDIEDIYQILRDENIFIKRNYYYNLFKNINYFGKIHNWQTIITKDSFKKYKDIYLKPSKKELKNKTKGIVQGAPVSGVLANIYTINADEQILHIVNRFHGLYMRYCDDFIVVLPNVSEDQFQEILNNIINVFSDNKLELKTKKMQLFKYENKKVINLNSLIKDTDFNKKEIQFLGFVLSDDGIIDVRGSTKSRTYNKILRDRKCNFSDISKVSRKISYRRLENGKKGIYKNYTYGNYLSKSIDVIGGDKLKHSKKDLVNFIDKHNKL